jgi:hypothetical protein
MEAVADVVKKAHPETTPKTLHLDSEVQSQKVANGVQSRRSLSLKKTNTPRQQKDEVDNFFSELAESQVPVGSEVVSKQETYPKDVIPFDLHRKKYKTSRKAAFDPTKLTLKQIQEQLQKRRQQDANFTQAELAKQTGLSAGYLSKILSGQRLLSDKNKIKLYKVLFGKEILETSAIRR